MTTRPSLWDQFRTKTCYLSDLREEAVYLQSFEIADEIIHLFRSRHPQLPWDKLDVRSLKESSGQSLWMLSYALEAYAAAGGETASYLEGIKRGVIPIVNN